MLFTVKIKNRTQLITQPLGTVFDLALGHSREIYSKPFTLHCNHITRSPVVHVNGVKTSRYTIIIDDYISPCSIEVYE